MVIVNNPLKSLYLVLATSVGYITKISQSPAKLPATTLFHIAGAAPLLIFPNPNQGLGTVRVSTTSGQCRFGADNVTTRWCDTTENAPFARNVD